MMFEFKYPVQPGEFICVSLKMEKLWLTKEESGLVKPSLNTKATKLIMKMAESKMALAKIAKRKPFYWEIIWM